MKYRLEDVAHLANVSKTTVSRVLNNKGYISEKTRENVYQAMQELNYHPNILAKQLYQQKTNIIGLLFPMVSNPFFGELIEELEKGLYSKGYKVIIGNSLNDPQKEKDYLNQLLTKQIDGLIVGTHNNGIKEYEYDGLPIVSIERTVSEKIPVIECDNYSGGTLATNYLYELGCRNIIHTTGRTSIEMPSNLRDKAYTDTMIRFGLTPCSYPIYFDMNDEEKKKHLKEMFIKYPNLDGIFAGNDVEAAIIIEVAQNLGKKIPQDIKLIGFDGTKLCRTLMPNLPTVIQPLELMASNAIKILEKRLNGEKFELRTTSPVKLYTGNVP
ncbi:LacI family DNA-binding transcriptional regulator [Lactococcus garvieae]|uniref:LacI family DNA-binding transcriptional regulator n=1 Tax=Lactococcus garvieae TaxID=1363 RepID=UPI0025501669|nr:LacI family DNA-binding transcriptional regulator [Lactococcus garvieae]